MPRVEFHLIPKYQVRSTVIISSYSLVWSFWNAKELQAQLLFIQITLYDCFCSLLLSPSVQTFASPTWTPTIMSNCTIPLSKVRKSSSSSCYFYYCCYLLISLLLLSLLLLLLLFIFYNFFYCCCNRLCWRKVVSRARALISRSLLSLLWKHTLNAIRNISNTRCSYKLDS